MKEQIEDIILSQWGNLVGVPKAADELTALICYREVRAYIHGNGAFSSYSEMVEYLKSDYPEDIILQSIEKYKNEQK